MDRVALVIKIAIRSLVAHKTKNLIVGSILGVGAFLIVLGDALLDNIERSMSKSITSSIAGHLHAYDKRARDPIALFGSGISSQEDIGHIDDFAPVKAAVMAHPNVAAIIPMGLESAFVTTGNDLDRLLEVFREAVQARDAAQVARLRGQIEEVARLLQSELEHSAKLAKPAPDAEQRRQDLEHVLSGKLWAELDTAPETVLLFLDTQLAPMLEEGRTVPLRYIGTDIQAFATHFDRFEIVSGQVVPAGKRGFLFNKKFYDDNFKHKVARDLDAIEKARTEEGKTIATDVLLQTRAAQVGRLYRRLTLQIDAEEAKALTPLLEQELPQLRGKPLGALLEALLTLDDANFQRRYDFFYRHIAPLIELYDVRVGDLVTVRATTRSGALKSVNVKVYGTFRFEGLDRSELAGGHNLMDLQSFRELYDLMTDERKAEVEQLRRKTTEVASSANADDAFFGGGEVVVEEQVEPAAGAAAPEQIIERVSAEERRRRVEEATFGPEVNERGVVLNAAVQLKDPEKLEETLAALAPVLAPLGVQLVSWQTASGLVGQFIDFVRLALVVGAVIIFFVGMIIINNSIMMATMERITEIGTLLAIGASEGLVLMMIVLETTALGLVAGLVGGSAALGALAFLERVGIPAVDSTTVFLFAGPRLFPAASAENLLTGLLIIIVVSIGSALYPAFTATRIPPRVAMQGKE